MRLRAYQQKCIDSIISEARQGVTRQVMVLATGTGKTVIFGHLPSKVRDKGKKTLILAHREELLTQAKDKILAIDPTLKVGIEQGKYNLNELEIDYLDVVIASVPTIGRAGSQRILKFKKEEFGLIIVDECHHATSSTYVNIFKHFDVLKGEAGEANNRVLLGCTATPSRADKVGLDKVFDKIVFSYSIQQGIEDEHLSDIKAYTVQTNTDLSHVHTRMGDFAEGELAEAVNDESRNMLIVDSYKDIADHSKALVFAVNVEHAEDLTTCFKQAGYKADFVVGVTDKDYRKKLLADFKSGELEVLVNVGVLTEGFDEPSIETILMARPTKSSVLFAQIVGRGTRLFPGKEHVNLIDFVDNTGRHSVIGIPSLFGMSKSLKGKGMRITEVVKKAEKILEANPDYDVESIEDWSDLNIKKIIKQVDILAQAELPAVVKSNSKYAWHRYLEGYKIQFPATEEVKEVVTIMPNILNCYEVYVERLKKSAPDYKNGYHKWTLDTKEMIGVYPVLFDAFKKGDSWINNNKGGYSTMMAQDSKWRKDGPSEKQIAFLKKRNIPIHKGLTKGLASNLIQKWINEHKK